MSGATYSGSDPRSAQRGLRSLSTIMARTPSRKSGWRVTPARQFEFGSETLAQGPVRSRGDDVE